MQKKFMALRVVSTIFKVLAWIILVAGFLGACATVAMGVMPGLVGGGPRGTGVVSATGLGAFGVLGGVVAGLGLVFFTLLYFLFVFAFGELINLLVSLEENTRLTAEHLLKLDEDTAPNASRVSSPPA